MAHILQRILDMLNEIIPCECSSHGDLQSHAKDQQCECGMILYHIYKLAYSITIITIFYMHLPAIHEQLCKTMIAKSKILAQMLAAINKI